MICQNCKRQTVKICLTAQGQRCDGCRNPSLSIAGNLRQRADVYRYRASVERDETQSQCLSVLAIECDQEADALEANNGKALA